MARGATRGGHRTPRAQLIARAPRVRLGAARLLAYGASRTTAEGILALRGLVLASLLGPAGFGVWTVFRLGVRYGAFANPGLDRAIELEVVRARTSETCSPDEPAAWGRTAAAYNWLVFGVLGIGLAAASFAVESAGTALVLRALAASLLLDRLWSYGRSYLRATGGLRRLATREIGYALLHVAFTLSLAAWAGTPGALAGFAFASALSVTWLARDVPLAPEFSLRRLRRLAAVGPPLITPVWLTLGLTTVDRLAVASRGDAALLGSYALAVALSEMVGSLALTIRTVVFPQVFADGGEGAAVRARLHLERTTRPFALLLPPAVGAFGLVLAPLFGLWLPEYGDAAPVARLFVFAGVFAGIQSLGMLSVAVAGSERPVPLLAALALALNAALSWLALEQGFGLIGVAVGALAARGAFAVAIAALAGGTAAPGRRLGAFGFVAPTLWCIAAMEGISRLLPVRSAADLFPGLGIYALCLVPLAPTILQQLRALGAEPEQPGPADAKKNGP